ncbi:methylenetetrahydrofolate reductase [Salinarimonas sp.]|uniref:methylenetetrahydrofolate reductase n=1 Tax=Salinarimonas sp. TaxID=2766526 RepID=UPI0032D8C0DB
MFDFLTRPRAAARGDPAGSGEAVAGEARRLVEELSLEATPRQIASASLARLGLPAGTEVSVPRLPGAGVEASAAACARLAADGMRPLAHLPARTLASRDELDRALRLLAEAGAAGLLLVAGDVERPAGPFRDTRDVLATGLLARHGFSDVAFAGHPEGLRHADAVELDAALADKIAWARESGARMRLLTQFVFDAAPVLAWMERLRVRDLAVPVRVGLPGPAKLATLVSYARQCGVGASARVLTARPDAARLVGGWSPDGVLADLAAGRLAAPDLPLAGIHLYAFGGPEALARWRAERLRAPAPRG